MWYENGMIYERKSECIMYEPEIHQVLFNS